MQRQQLVSLLALLAVGLVVEQARAQRQMVVAGDEIQIPLVAGRTPHWSGNVLVGCDNCRSGAPILWTIDRQSFRQATVLEVPGAGYVHVWDVASGLDGALAAVGYAATSDGRFVDFVAWIAPDGSNQVITRTSPYGASVVALSPDGTIWTVGSMKDEVTSLEVDPAVLRHYDPAGRLLTTTSVHPNRQFHGANVHQASRLMTSNDRVGWLTIACEYIEFSFSAQEIGRYTCPDAAPDILSAGGVALSSADDLLVAGKPFGPLAPLALDRSTGKWNPVAVPADTRSSSGLLGFDGLTLVVQRSDGRLQPLTWARSAPSVP
jgi:hypothetical protein